MRAAQPAGRDPGLRADRADDHERPELRHGVGPGLAVPAGRRGLRPQRRGRARWPARGPRGPRGRWPPERPGHAGRRGRHLRGDRRPAHRRVTRHRRRGISGHQHPWISYFGGARGFYAFVMKTRGDLLRSDSGEGLDGLERRELVIAGVRRTYWLARTTSGPAASPGTLGTAPLLIVLHGSGMNGRAMARFTGLATRGPAAGLTTVFPDGWKGVWHAARPPKREPSLDDVEFLSTLSGHLEAIGVARAWPFFLAG